jgi:hypothetical protein
MYIQFAIPFRLIGLTVREFAIAMTPQLLITAGMSVACLLWILALHRLSIFNPWVELLSTSALGALVYCGLLIRLRPPAIHALEEILGGSQKPILVKAIRVVQRLGGASKI